MSGPGFRRGAAALTLALLVACTGMEGTGYSDGGGVVGGIEGSGYSGGGVTGIGSVFVNGIEYDTSQAQIIYDGASATEDALQVGMVLGVHGDVASDGVHGMAKRVVFDPQLVGPVEAIDADTGKFSILGQPVQTSDDVVFSGVTPEALAEGDYCTVSGYRGAASLAASYVRCDDIAYVPGSTRVKIEGIVSSLAGTTFHIGTLAVDFAQAQTNTTAGTLANDALVSVEGVQAGSGAALSARRVQVMPVAPARRGQAVRLEGVISGFGGLGSFSVSGQPVNAAGAVRDDQSTLSPANDVRISVIGTVDNAGVLQATHFALRPGSEALYSGAVDSVDVANGEVAVFGLAATVSVDGTQLEDGSSTGVRNFGLDDLHPGDYVELSTYRDVSGARQATRVARRDAQARDGMLMAPTPTALRTSTPLPVSTDPNFVRVRDKVDRIDAMQGTIDVAGVRVSTNRVTTRFTDRDGNAMTSDEFFASLSVGDKVDAGGGESADGIAADSVGFRR